MTHSGHRRDVFEMTKKSKRYIDSEGVERGFYVYLHRDTATQSVFYVGKGHGDRAWKTTGRNTLWQQHVESLEGDWRVEIIHDDLREIEAFQIEGELVEKFGGPAALGGSLKNWIPGGEEPASVTIDISLGEFGESLNAHYEVYAEARKFKKLPVTERKRIAELTLADLDLLQIENAKMSFEAEDEDNTILVESLDTAQSNIYELADTCRELKGRRISWQDFCLSFEEMLEQLEYEMDDTDELHPKAIALMKRAASVGRKTLAQFDSGNKVEAERIAREATAKS